MPSISDLSWFAFLKDLRSILQQEVVPDFDQFSVPKLYIALTVSELSPC